MKTAIFTWLTLSASVLLCSAAPLNGPDSKPKPTVCTVHREKLKPDWVKIQYGLPPYEKGLFEARQKQFPNAVTVVEGGCVVMSHDPQFMKVDYCGKCRTALWRWRQKEARLKQAEQKNKR